MNYDDSEEPIFNRNLVVPTLLFGILSPGLLLTLPAESRGFWLSGTLPLPLSPSLEPTSD
jgi:hypothetical protein